MAPSFSSICSDKLFTVCLPLKKKRKKKEKEQKRTPLQTEPGVRCSASHLQQVSVQDLLPAAGARVLPGGRRRAGGGGRRAHGRGGRGAGGRASVLPLHVGPLGFSVRVRLQRGHHSTAQGEKKTDTNTHTESKTLLITISILTLTLSPFFIITHEKK